MLSKYTQKFLWVVYTYETNNSFHNGLSSKVKPNKYILIYDYRYMPWHRSKYVMTWLMDIANMTAYLGMFLVFHTHVMHILDKTLFCEALEVHWWDRRLALYTWTWDWDFIWNFRCKKVFKYSSYMSFSHFFANC
jgi:hypothetical protein